MAIFNVTNLSDSGAGSLRQAILNANSTTGADEIQFSSISGTITLTSGQLNITDSLNINGSSTNTLSVSSRFSTRVFNIDDGSSSLIDVVIDGLTIANGYARYNRSGGGLRNKENLTLTNSTVSQNAASLEGGGVYNLGILSISDSTISGNFSEKGGGGITNGTTAVNYANLSISDSTISGNLSYGSGGGIDNSGSLSISNSTISGNTAPFAGGVSNVGGITSISSSTISDNMADVVGGGVGNYQGTTSISNSTISGNTASIGDGGGVFNSGGTTIISNSTISGNTASVGGGVSNSSYSALDLTNTIIANSPNGGDCLNDGTLATNINNLIEDGSCNPALSGDPNLGQLQDNGGPTFTQALLPSSIAIDGGSNAAIPPGLTTDQRGVGFPRIINGTVDIGAYEAGQNVPPPVPEPSSLFSIVTLALVAVGSWRRRQ